MVSTFCCNAHLHVITHHAQAVLLLHVRYSNLFYFKHALNFSSLRRLNVLTNYINQVIQKFTALET